MKKLLLLTILLLTACGNSAPEYLPTQDGEYTPDIAEDTIYPHVSEPHYKTVKYAEEPIEITAKYITCDTSASSWIESATYEPTRQFLILKLANTNYQYCEVPSSIWDNFCNANSHGTYYNQNIKENYACR